MQRAKNWKRLFVVGIVGVLVGCNGSSSEPPVGPDLNGSWAGRLTIRRGSGPDKPLTATIHHEGDAVTISTSLEGLGASFSGTIDAEGNMRLTDAFDGETWTTFFGPATVNSVRIEDFIHPPELGDPNPLRSIELTR